MIKKYHTGDIPLVLLDDARAKMVSSLKSMSTTELQKNLNQYRTNTQVAAMMTKSGSIWHVPFNCKSKFADAPLSMSLFKAWNEVYKVAKEEISSRIPNLVY